MFLRRTSLAISYQPSAISLVAQMLKADGCKLKAKQ